MIGPRALFMRRWRRPPVIPPENVRIVRSDGTEIPCECIYRGVRRGLHVWAAVTPVRIEAADWHIAIDMMPARSTVEIYLSFPAPID